MTHDAFVGQFVTLVRGELANIKEDLVSARFEDMYQLGKLQGVASGLQKALNLLEEAYRDQDE